jgi:hypothetical protein
MTTKKHGHSRYDELHDKYHTILTTKSGTRYERLAAMVFKALEKKNVVIHDLKLSGDDPEVKHQIDVTIEIDGIKKTRLIECKDFDIARDKVGLGIIRDFRSVLEDTKADEGIVISCIGFTEGARKYAKSKGIKLAVLRVVETVDLNGYLTKIRIGFVIQMPANPSANVAIPENVSQLYSGQMEAIGAKGGIRNTDPVFFVRGSERHQFNAFLTERMNEATPPAGTNAIEIVIPPDNWLIQISTNPPIPFDGIAVKFDVDEERHTAEVISDRVAELLLTGFGQDDIIIYWDEIERRSIDPDTGEVK